MEDLEGRNVNNTYYSMSDGVQVDNDTRGQDPQEGDIWSIFLKQIWKGKLRVDEAYEVE